MEYRAEDYQRAFGRLCHVAALSRNGKVEAALDSLVATTLALDSDAGAGASALQTGIAGYFGLRPPPAELERSVKRLTTSGVVETDAAGVVRVSDATARAVAQRTEEAQQLEAEVRAEWDDQLAQLEPPSGTDRDDRWRTLSAFMAKAFRRHGVQTLRLLSPGLGEEDRSDGSVYALLTEALSETGIGTPEREAVGAAIAAFFNTGTDLRTRYLSQLLDATFTFFALTADDVTAEYLRSGLKPLSVFLDTNFIFGVIGFHADHFVEVSSEIVELIRTQHLPFKLYYHERTLRELQDTIAAIGRRLRQRRWTQEISRAAVRAAADSGELSSVELAYHAVNAKTPTSPDLFLSKYENMEPLLAARGFTIYRESGTSPVSVEVKGRLVADYDAYVRGERPARPKPYEAIDHDIVLWLAVSHLRENRRSVLDSGALFLTNDFLLYRYAWRHLRKPGEISGVVVPLQLLQVLRPFVPTTDDFDRRFVENFNIPEFRTVQSSYSQVAATVLSYLALYSDVPEETAVRILTDGVLKNRLRTVSEDSAEFRELIDSAILDANRELLEEREALHAEIESLRVDQASAGGRLMAAVEAESARRLAAEQASEASQSAAAASEEALREARAAITRQGSERDKTEREIADRAGVLEREIEAQRSRVRNLIVVFISLLGIGTLWVAQAVIPWDWLDHHPQRFGLLIVASVLVATIVWTAVHRRIAGAGIAAILAAILALAALVDYG